QPAHAVVLLIDDVEGVIWTNGNRGRRAEARRRRGSPVPAESHRPVASDRGDAPVGRHLPHPTGVISDIHAAIAPDRDAAGGALGEGGGAAPAAAAGGRGAARPRPCGGADPPAGPAGGDTMFGRGGDEARVPRPAPRPQRFIVLCWRPGAAIAADPRH